MRVANGRKMMPRSGQSQVLKAASTRAGRATQTMNRASRGKTPANNANKQPMTAPLVGLVPRPCPGDSGAGITHRG